MQLVAFGAHNPKVAGSSPVPATIQIYFSQFTTMKVTPEELHERQKWSLDQKIDHSLGVIEQFYNYTNGECVIMFSGGIDSTVLLHLARRIYPNIKGVFVNTTNELSEILKFVRNTNNIDTILPKMTFLQTVEKYGFPLVSKKVAKAIQYIKYPSPKNDKVRNLVLTGINSKGQPCPSYKLAKKWYFLKDVDFEITHKCCEILKHKPFNEYQKIHKVYPITGIMAENSHLRRGNYLQYGCNILNSKKSISRPLEIWLNNDIWEYQRKYNIPYCDVYDKGENNTGCAYCAFGCHLEKESRFDRLKEREPKRYEQMMKLKNNGVTYEEAIRMVLK